MTSQPSLTEWSLEEFDIQPSLWRLIEEFVAEPERPEIKEVIGEGLIEETVELHEEATSLLDIWRDYRDETDKEEKNVALNRHISALPEPPMMRENLKKEIQMFVEMLQQKNRFDNSQVSKILSNKDESIVDYVIGSRSNSSQSPRPSTASSRPSTAMSSSSGHQTPLRATPRSDGSSCASSVSDQLESMNDNLNALEIDRVAEHLRGLFIDEKNRLNDEIVFLQECLFEESDYRQQVLSSPEPEPSLRDLRELGTKLEKEILNNNKIINTPKTNKRKPVSYKQNSLDEHSLEHNIHRLLPSKPNMPKPPTSPPERQTKTSLPSRTFTIPSGTTRSQKCSPSPPGTANPANRNIIPSPPSSAKPQVQRPSTASRFRRMVVDCRESSS